MTTDCLNAAGGPSSRRRVIRQKQRLQKSLNVDGFDLDSDSGVLNPVERDPFEFDSDGGPRFERNLANVFPFVGGERAPDRFRELDPVLHSSRHEDHQDHIAHHADHLEHHDEHPNHHIEHHDPHHDAHHDQRHHDQHHHDQHLDDQHDQHHQDHNDHHVRHEEPSLNQFPFSQNIEPVSNTLIDSRSARQRNRGEEEVALDIGSIAAAGERCIDKVVMVQETEYDDVVTCKHSYSEKCHTTYTTDFEPQQEEECEDNYIKNCFIEYKKIAGEETVEFCHTPLVCEGEGPVECKTVYESQCQTRYHEHDVEEDKVECETIQEEKCEDVTQGYTTEKKCTKWPKQVCSSNRENVKKYSPETECKKVPRQLCGPSGCQLAAGPEECFDRKETVVQEVRLTVLNSLFLGYMSYHYVFFCS